MMQALPPHPLIEDYLRRLRAAAEPLGPGRARELVDDIGEHLAEALPEPEPETDDVRRVLGRLGEPHDVVAAAWEDPVGDPSGRARVGAPSGRGREPWRYVTALALLITAELFAPLWPFSLPAWIVGLALFATVTGWTARERALGWVFLGAGFPMGLLFTIAALMPFAMTSQECIGLPDGSQQCTGTTAPGWAAGAVLAVFVASAIGQIITLVKLVGAQRRRRPTETGM